MELNEGMVFTRNSVFLKYVVKKKVLHACEVLRLMFLCSTHQPPKLYNLRPGSHGAINQ